ncbi:related to rRNA biogenesis protein RRP36 [Cephalotrichum gorgonifer]|uniref:rRNA biogenesis protein RRP36 n=1 Tax=Cephalotrichum gorgonifer TaxID=2041049 RepID=A0AAE8MRA3_9PEZI|nr:related to rRNA biogenesis protein RRP36 [Cephalotrichum gorgonifer]
MLSNKRKLGETGLGRRVRARKEEESDVEVEGSEAPSEEEVDASEGSSDDEENDGEELSDEELDDQPEDKPPAVDFSIISFGDLAKADAALSKQSKKKAAQSETTTPRDARPDWTAGTKPTLKSTPAKRSSKHAPTEQSSKYAVSRKRDIIADTRPKPRDPRFDPLSGRLDERKFKKAYSFLDSYRDDEIKQLRESIKKTKEGHAKEELKRKLKSLEGKKERERKEEEKRKVLEDHKKQEKELVKQGKTPYYLKKAEQKKRVLTERFKGMSKGKAEKAIERRRKKEAVRDRRAYEEVERATGYRARRA